MFPSSHFSIPHLHFQEKGSEQDMRLILLSTEKRPHPQDLNHANIFTTAASRLSVSDLPQLLLICRKLLQTKTLLLPLCLFLPYPMPPIQRSFSLLLPPSPNSLSQQPLLCRPHTWRVESSPIWQAQITTKKGKKRKKKKKLFSGLEDSSVFLSGGSNLICCPFTMIQREWRWIPRPRILTNQPSQK